MISSHSRLPCSGKSVTAKCFQHGRVDAAVEGRTYRTALDVGACGRDSAADSAAFRPRSAALVDRDSGQPGADGRPAGFNSAEPGVGAARHPHSSELSATAILRADFPDIAVQHLPSGPETCAERHPPGAGSRTGIEREAGKPFPD